MPFKFEDTPIRDLKIITPHIFEDERGFLIKPYMKSEFEKNGITCSFSEEMHQITKSRYTRVALPTKDYKKLYINNYCLN